MGPGTSDNIRNDGLMRFLAYRPSDGVLPVESATIRIYTLGQFFAVWGVRLSPNCLGGWPV